MFLEPKCPPNYEHVAYDGYEDLGCIKLVLDPSTWDDARSKCQAEGADLVTLKENPNDMTPLILLRQESELYANCFISKHAIVNFCKVII